MAMNGVEGAYAFMSTSGDPYTALFRYRYAGLKIAMLHCVSSISHASPRGFTAHAIRLASSPQWALLAVALIDDIKVRLRLHCRPYVPDRLCVPIASHGMIDIRGLDFIPE